MTSSFLSKLLSGTLLVAGTTIGAGMLGIPVATAQSGFPVAVVVTLLVWVFMLISGLMLLKVTLLFPDHKSFLTISASLLGKTGETVTGLWFVFLYFSLMIAYTAAGGHLLVSLANSYGWSADYILTTALFTIVFMTVVIVGPKSIDRVNTVLAITMFVIWMILMVLGAGSVNVTNLKKYDLSYLTTSLPLFFGAFGYHNIIPSLASYLDRDRKVLTLSVIFGTLIPCLVYLFWQWLIIGAVPHQILELVRLQGLPATFALQHVGNQASLALLGQWFAIFAITTSVLGVAFSLIDFLADGFQVMATGFNRVWMGLVVFIVPFCLAIYNPTIFTSALGIAGGFGETMLNGMLPVLCIWMAKYQTKPIDPVIGYDIWSSKAVYMLMLLFCVSVILIELMQLI